MRANSFNHVGTQAQLRPEWIRVDAAIRHFGLSRTKLYELITDRKIKSFCLRERNKIKGIRLISFDSLDQFLNNRAKPADSTAPTFPPFTSKERSQRS